MSATSQSTPQLVTGGNITPNHTTKTARFPSTPQENAYYNTRFAQDHPIINRMMQNARKNTAGLSRWHPKAVWTGIRLSFVIALVNIPFATMYLELKTYEKDWADSLVQAQRTAQRKQDRDRIDDLEAQVARLTQQLAQDTEN